MSSREVTPFQPTLPAEVTWTDAEFAFHDDSPEHLFPDNQNSNAGLFRKIFSDIIQSLIEQQNLLYNERFIDTSTLFLDEYERMVGLPPNPANKTIQQRRYEVELRLIRGPFTRARRDEVIERYIGATFGPPVELTAPGVALTPAGIPLYAESGDISAAYKVNENIPSGINLVSNGSFETNTTGWGGQNSTLVRDATRSKFGTASLKHTVTTSAYSDATYNVTISGNTQGRVYRASAWVYADAIHVGQTFALYLRESGGVNTYGQAVTTATLVAGWNFITVTRAFDEHDRTTISLFFVPQAPTAGQSVWIDGVQVELASSNFIPNGHFETDLGGWWQATTPNSTISRVTTEKQAGVASMKMVSTGSQSGIGSYLSPIPLKGAQYRVTAYVKGEGAAVGKQGRLQINETGGPVGDVGTGIYFNLTNTWQLITTVHTVQEDDRSGMYFFVILTACATGDVFYLDTANCVVEPIPAPSAFVDSAVTPFYYEVRILDSLAPDMVGLNRELKRITPAGISYDIRLVPTP